MVKIISNKAQTIKLIKGKKILERPLVDYHSNKRIWEIRGFKPYKDEVKVESKVDDKVVSLKPKKKTRKKKWTSGLYLKLGNGQNGFG